MNEKPHPAEIEEDPGVANAEEGQVILDGPDGVAVTMTPDAATRTGQSLIDAANQARGQQDGEREA